MKMVGTIKVLSVLFGCLRSHQILVVLGLLCTQPQHDDADWHRVIDPSFKIRAAKPKAANSRSPANFSLNGGSIPILVVDTAVPERRMDVQKGVVLQAWGTAPIELQNVAKKTNTRSVEPSKPNGFRRLFCCGAE